MGVDIFKIYFLWIKEKSIFVYNVFQVIKLSIFSIFFQFGWMEPQVFRKEVSNINITPCEWISLLIIWNQWTINQLYHNLNTLTYYYTEWNIYLGFLPEIFTGLSYNTVTKSHNIISRCASKLFVAKLRILAAQFTNDSYKFRELQ